MPTHATQGLGSYPRTELFPDPAETLICVNLQTGLTAPSDLSRYARAIRYLIKGVTHAHNRSRRFNAGR